MEYRVRGATHLNVWNVLRVNALYFMLPRCGAVWFVRGCCSGFVLRVRGLLVWTANIFWGEWINFVNLSGLTLCVEIRGLRARIGDNSMSGWTIEGKRLTINLEDILWQKRKRPRLR